MTNYEYFVDCVGGNAEKHTIGQFITAVMKIDNEEDARRFHGGYLLWLRGRTDIEPKYTPEQVASANIGWCYGEDMAGDRVEMWIKACNASHPFFGQSKPTTGDALWSGVKAAMGPGIE